MAYLTLYFLDFFEVLTDFEFLKNGFFDIAEFATLFLTKCRLSFYYLYLVVCIFQSS